MQQQLTEAQSENTRLQSERDQARRHRDEALAQNTQLIQQLEGAQAQIVQLQEQLAATRPSKTVMQLNAELEAATHAAENLKKERDQQRQQLEAGAPGASLDLEAMQAIRDRILSQTRSDKLKAVKAALDEFIKAL